MSREDLLQIFTTEATEVHRGNSTEGLSSYQFGIFLLSILCFVLHYLSPCFSFGGNIHPRQVYL